MTFSQRILKTDRPSGWRHPLQTLFTARSPAAVDRLVSTTGNLGASGAASPPPLCPPRPIAGRGDTPGRHASAEVPARGLWVWNTQEVIEPTGQGTEELLGSARSAGVTDLFIHVAPRDYLDETTQPRLRAFIDRATNAGVRVWGLDGDRGYLHDPPASLRGRRYAEGEAPYGPTPFYDGIRNLLRYNATVAPDERFVGLQADIEPQDVGEYQTFHDGLRDGALSPEAPGVWQASQAQDREALMQDWLEIHETAGAMLHAGGLLFGAAIASWLSHYWGQPVGVSYPPGSPRRGAVELLLSRGGVDDCVLMTYNTNPASVVERALPAVRFASTLAPSARPRVYGALETAPGVARGVSYGDTPGKQSRQAALIDLRIVTERLASYPAFGGMCVHDWAGWKRLPDV
jgi:hypothetical protein